MIQIGNIDILPEEIEYTNRNVKIKINNQEFLRGDIFITKREVAWRPHNPLLTGFSIPWNKVIIQAISSDPERCIYFQIDSIFPTNHPENGANGEHHNGEHENGNGHHHEEEFHQADNDEDDEERDAAAGGDDGDEGEEEEESNFMQFDEEQSEMTEFWIIPDNRDDIDDLYFAMTRFPERELMDEDGSDEDDDSDEDEFFDGEDMEQMNLNDEEKYADASD